MADFREHEEKTQGLAAAVRAAIAGGDPAPPKREQIVETSAFFTFGAEAFLTPSEEPDDQEA